MEAPVMANPSELEGDLQTEVNLQLNYESTRDNELDDALFATPQQIGKFTYGTPASGSRSTVLTRSMSRVASQQSLDPSLPVVVTPLQQRLRAASSRVHATPGNARLEDSEGIQYENDPDHDDGVLFHLPPMYAEVGDADHPADGQLRMPLRRSDRIKGRRGTSRDNTPGNDEKVEKALRARTKRRKLSVSKVKKLPLRRSHRLSKPLTYFHLYPKLPNEIKLMIWEALVTPRAVYIRNRSSLLAMGQLRNQIERPLWFDACLISKEISQAYYKRMFTLHEPANEDTAIDVNANMDIIILEPCCNGCRGYYCARHQFSEEDRNAVRFLAVQNESPHLLPTTSPCWSTISLAWPNVETLYLMKDAVRGESTQDKAIVRIDAKQPELDLRKRFDEWKKSDVGRTRRIGSLEFIRVVDRESEQADLTKRYGAVEDRKTGFPDDVIIG